MHPRFVALLQCPTTREPLELTIHTQTPGGLVDTGVLTAPSGARYPIVAGVPRFVAEEAYAESFGFEWTRWPRVQFEAANESSTMRGATETMWEEITTWKPSELRGKHVVEFGCGPGRFLDVVRRRGGVAIGLDLSRAVDAARRNFADDPDVFIVQGDALRSPFKDEVFQFGYSIGVFHHTPAPFSGVREMSRTVEPGGGVAVTVYRRDGFYDFPSLGMLRRLHKAAAPRFGHRPALAYSHVASRVLYPAYSALSRVGGGRELAYFAQKYVLPTYWVSDPKWRVLDMFDAITPAYASVHEPEEVAGWLEGVGVGDLQKSKWNPSGAASFSGRKRRG